MPDGTFDALGAWSLEDDVAYSMSEGKVGFRTVTRDVVPDRWQRVDVTLKREPCSRSG